MGVVAVMLGCAGAASAGSAPTQGSEPTQTAQAVQADAPEKGSDRIGLDVALKAAVLVPSGKTAGATAGADGEATAGRQVFGSALLGVRYAPPFLDRALALSVESGFYRLSGSGTRAFANDPDFGDELTYRWQADAIPVLVGLSYRLPFALPLKLELSPTAGFAAVHLTARSTYVSSANGTEVENAAQRAWATGFYGGLEAGLKLGPGTAIAELRYLNARTDLGFGDLYGGAYNQQPGDVQGTNLLLGYRYAF